LSSNLGAWQAYIENELAKLRGIPSVAADWGVESSPAPGWVFVPFNRVFPGVPGVVAVQGPRAVSPKSQSLTPPKVTPPSLSVPRVAAPSLAALVVNAPSPPKSWGDQAKQYVVSGCQSTIGQITFIGGYLCSGIDATFGELARIVFNAVQALYYAFDSPALIANIEQGVEAKIAADWNDAIAKWQNALDSSFDEINGGLATFAGDVNGALRTLTADAQDAVNAVYGFLNSAIGLFQGLSIPVTQIRNVSATGFEVYSPGNSTPVYWLALYAS
jgi:hypothetical protein